jgi:hypothetical protein
MSNKAQQVEFLLSENPEAVLGSATFYAAGTDTLKTIWLDRDKGSTAANPYTLDANGCSGVPLFADGIYKVVVKDAAGATLYTRDGITYALQDGPWVDVTTYGSLNLAVAAIGSSEVDILIDDDTTVTANLSIPANINLKVTVGGSIAQSTYTVAIAGDFSAPDMTVFTGTGQISFSRISTVNPRWFGTDTAVSLNMAIGSLANGGTVDATGYTGAQTITDKISLDVAGITLKMGAATFTLSGVAAVQSPFGANFHITAENVKMLADGTVLKHAAGSEATMIGVLHGTSDVVIDGFELDGNSANNTSIIDDSFQSGIQIICDSGGGATKDAKVTITNNKIHHFNHYGIVTYGDKSGDCTIENNEVYSNGKADTYGTGDGIYINRGTNRVLVQGNKAYSNRRSGIRCSTAGTAQLNNSIISNVCYSNSLDGIRIDEAIDISSVAGTGQTNISIIGNTCYGNTDVGLRLSVTDSTGFIKNALISNNIVTNNGYGILLQTQASNATNAILQPLVIGNMVHSNTHEGIGISAYTLSAVVTNNLCIGNGSPVVDAGTNTITSWNTTSATTTFLLPNLPIQLNALALMWNESAVRTWQIVTSSGNLALTSGDTGGIFTTNCKFKPTLPTSAAGLVAGTLWNDTGVVKVAP